MPLDHTFASESDDYAAVVAISFGVRLVVYLLPTNNNTITRRELLLLLSVTTIFELMFILPFPQTPETGGPVLCSLHT